MTTTDFHRIMSDRPGWRKVASAAYNYHPAGRPTNLGAAWFRDRARLVLGGEAGERPMPTDSAIEGEFMLRLGELERVAE